MKYRVWIKLEGEYDDIEADSPEDALAIVVCGSVKLKNQNR